MRFDLVVAIPENAWLNMLHHPGIAILVALWPNSKVPLHFVVTQQVPYESTRLISVHHLLYAKNFLFDYKVEQILVSRKKKNIYTEELENVYSILHTFNTS